MYYAVYKSSTEGQTGCVQLFATPPRDALSFPPQVTYRCTLCDVEHGFRLYRFFTVDTPKKSRSFTEYCQQHSIEMDVELH